MSPEEFAAHARTIRSNDRSRYACDCSHCAVSKAATAILTHAESLRAALVRADPQAALEVFFSEQTT